MIEKLLLRKYRVEAKQFGRRRSLYERSGKKHFFLQVTTRQNVGHGHIDSNWLLFTAYLRCLKNSRPSVV